MRKSLFLALRKRLGSIAALSQPGAQGRCPVKAAVRTGPPLTRGSQQYAAADHFGISGKPAPPVKGLRSQVNSTHTGSVAKSHCVDLLLRNRVQ